MSTTKEFALSSSDINRINYLGTKTIPEVTSIKIFYLFSWA